MFLKSLGSLTNDLKTDLRALRDVQQRILSVRLIQHPQHRHLADSRVCRSAHHAVQPALAQLRLALRIQIYKRAIVLEDREDFQADRQRFSQFIGTHEFQVVR